MESRGLVDSPSNTPQEKVQGRKERRKGTEQASSRPLSWLFYSQSVQDSMPWMHFYVLKGLLQFTFRWIERGVRENTMHRLQKY